MDNYLEHTMQLYLDSANMKEIEIINSYGFINGITTNPSLLAKEDPSLSIKDLIVSIYKTIGGHVSVEVNSTDTAGMLKEAEDAVLTVGVIGVQGIIIILYFLRNLLQMDFQNLYQYIL